MFQLEAPANAFLKPFIVAEKQLQVASMVNANGNSFDKPCHIRVPVLRLNEQNQTKDRNHIISYQSISKMLTSESIREFIMKSM